MDNYIRIKENYETIKDHYKLINEYHETITDSLQQGFQDFMVFQFLSLTG